MAVRVAEKSDLKDILSIYAPYVTDTAITFEYSVPTEAEFLHRFEAVTAQFPWLVWEEKGRILGYAHGSAPFHRDAYQWCAEASVYLRPEAQGKGIGKALYQALERCLTRQGYQTLYALITADNQRSLGFHKAAGYRYLAAFPDCGFKLGRWYSVVWMEKRLNFVKKPGSPPIPWPHFVNLPENLHGF